MIEQERLSRHKRAFEEPPTDAIAACLDFAHITLDDLDAVAVGWDIPAYAQANNETYNEQAFWERNFPLECFPRTRLPDLYFINHHLAHAASAFWVSGFERAAIIIIDGNGETQATSIGIGTPDGLHMLAKLDITQSLGYFYAEASAWAGLSYWDAGKLMGLACYGQANQHMPITITPTGYRFPGARPVSQDVSSQILQQRSFLRQYFRHTNYPFCAGDKREIMAYANFAASAQHALEEAVLQLLRVTRQQTDEEYLVMAGGVAMNCSMNGRLLRSHIFKDIYIPPVPYDAGVSLGAALVVQQRLEGIQAGAFRLDHAYWTPPIPEQQQQQAILQSGMEAQSLDEETLLERVVAHMEAGHFVGWFQGRAEVGQRALGARSIIGDPRQRSHLIRLNTLKGREIWRPLAPSILEEYTHDIFGTELPPLANFMLSAWPVRQDVQHLLPAIVHVDGTARPQVVQQHLQPRYWRLIQKFRERTGLPAIINTSFNLAGEPIVHHPRDAVRAFTQSELDVLVLDNFIIEKPSAALQQE
jgi:carbamoyltransferase